MNNSGLELIAVLTHNDIGQPCKSASALEKVKLKNENVQK